MKIGLTKPVLLNAGNGQAYDLPMGVTDMDHSMLAPLLERHRDALDIRYIPAMEDAIYGANPNNPRNSAIRQVMTDDEAKDLDGDMDDPIQIDSPTNPNKDGSKNPHLVTLEDTNYGKHYADTAPVAPGSTGKKPAVTSGTASTGTPTTSTPSSSKAANGK